MTMRLGSMKATMWRMVCSKSAPRYASPWHAGPWRPDRNHIGMCAVAHIMRGGEHLWVQNTHGEVFDLEGMMVAKVKF